jgi:hypothetical protein
MPPNPANWLFRNRRTGQITIAQLPNVPLWVFLIATALRIIIDPTGWPGTALRLAATTALLYWAADEILRGVNPWRRLLGAAVLAAQLARLVI